LGRRRDVTELSLVLAATPPAGGAALREVIGATAGVVPVTLALVALAYGHRTRRSTLLQRAADAAGRRMDRPGWVALPSAIAFVALVAALFGMLWDISLHIAEGRDAGPLANPAHYFILVGLYLLFAAGVLAVVLPLEEAPGPASVRITGSWRAPVGGILVAGAGFYALLGFPLDDVWHRLFGQDVTLWGPTHLMLITGAGLSLVGLLVLDREAGADVRGSWLVRTASFGGMLLGLSVFQAEFDFGVPQFRLVFQPMLIAAAAALALVAARLVQGRGAAVAAVTFFLLLRASISALVGPLLGEPTPAFPLYLGEAFLIELLALTPLARRPLAFGAVAGGLVGTVGLATEAAWTRVAYTLPWTSDAWPEAIVIALPVAVGMGLTGAVLALGLQGRLPRRGIARAIVVATVVVIGVAVADGLRIDVPRATAAVRLTDVTSGEARTAMADVRLSRVGLVDDESWLEITSWQGGGLVVDHLERTGPGTYRSTTPVPVHGDWKTLLRLQDGRTLTALPIYLPADAAIGADEVPATASFERPFQPEIQILQRERKLGVSADLFTAASVVVLVLSLVLVAALAWGVGRLAGGLSGRRDDASAQPAAADRRVGVATATSSGW
jgi:hypothetical protein